MNPYGAEEEERVKDITPKQRAVLSLVEEHWRRRGMGPSLAELAHRLSISRPAVHDHLLALEKKGFLEHAEGIGRSWRPSSVATWGTAEKVPLVGRVAAGKPILAKENIEGWVPVDRSHPGETLFALRVKGDSMVDIGILEGDVVIVRHQETADSGEIVVALVDDEEATVKRLGRTGPTVQLKPENSSMPVMELPAHRVCIQGKVVGLLRHYP